MRIGKNAGWILFWMLMASILVSLLLYTEPKRDAILDQRLAMIENARTVDDLKPILKEIVADQRRYNY